MRWGRSSMSRPPPRSRRRPSSRCWSGARSPGPRSAPRFRTGRPPSRRGYPLGMLVLAIILFGMLVGAGAQLILGRSHGRIDWTMAIVAGLVGSFVGGLLVSLIAGDGLALRPSGIIGSVVGAVVVTFAWRRSTDRKKSTAAARAAKRSGDPRKSHPR